MSSPTSLRTASIRRRLHPFHGLLRAWKVARARFTTQPRHHADRGQTTAEYGLVILAAGSLALAAILWARSSGSITSLFESVIEQLTGSIG